MTDEHDPELDALAASVAGSEQRIALLNRQLQGRKLRAAVDAGVIDATTAAALLDFWTPEP